MLGQGYMQRATVLSAAAEYNIGDEINFCDRLVYDLAFADYSTAYEKGNLKAAIYKNQLEDFFYFQTSLTNLVKKMETIVIIGAMANNFIKHKGYNIGKSLFEPNKENLIKDVIKQAKTNNCNLIFPQDVVVSKNHGSKGQLKSLDKIDDMDLILDIVKKNLLEFQKVLTFNEGNIPEIFKNSSHPTKVDFLHIDLKVLLNQKRRVTLR